MCKSDPHNEITGVFTEKHILFSLNAMSIHLDQG